MTEHIDRVNQSSEYLTYVVQELCNTYELLQNQNLDLKPLEETLDALLHANNKLNEMKPILEERLSKLRAKASS